MRECVFVCVSWLAQYCDLTNSKLCASNTFSKHSVSSRFLWLHAVPILCTLYDGNRLRIRTYNVLYTNCVNSASTSNKFSAGHVTDLCCLSFDLEIGWFVASLFWSVFGIWNVIRLSNCSIREKCSDCISWKFIWFLKWQISISWLSSAFPFIRNFFLLFIYVFGYSNGYWTVSGGRYGVHKNRFESSARNQWQTWTRRHQFTSNRSIAYTKHCHQTGRRESRQYWTEI